ncbi:hypothetical protein HII12_002626 [Brettanomyces bruxellensis]|uniref:Uncharacterized protein n=1 Tax=Dekkera bruxellensis TaxID=5007 RepID=A0A8H6EUN5_DEKBR|nr:hypothetical protein HII12_002626 [Brettanomyces bruxellensis]
MSAFEDFCIVCDKQCAPNSVYCSEECRRLDEEQSFSPSLSACNSINQYYGEDSATPALIPKVTSPLLTPQFLPRSTISYCASQNVHGISRNVLSTPEPKTLSYESPMLSCSSCKDSGDLDCNSLDLNAASAVRMDKLHSFGSLHVVSNVSNVLDSCASENYRKWLAMH